MIDNKDLAWEEIEREHIVQDEWIDFRKSTFRHPDGKVFSPYYTYSRRDYTVIVASDEDGKYLCVRQFRQGIMEVTTEFPAGGIERKDGKEYGSRDASEAALDCAKRELREETGYESTDWIHLITIPSNATIADNYAYVFMARNCKKAGEQQLDETEYLNVERYTADEIENLIHTGKFEQSVHVMAWLLAKEKQHDTVSGTSKIQNMKCPYRSIIKREGNTETQDFADCYMKKCPNYRGRGVCIKTITDLADEIRNNSKSSQ
ncbi:MAG: NUDIX hydrolase [Lachnospiraceae bacterium]|nr:NUDIX hydrolase [Lachnospiraceae bacterium]